MIAWKSLAVVPIDQTRRFSTPLVRSEGPFLYSCLGRDRFSDYPFTDPDIFSEE